MKRIAVCLSGQSRTWKYCVDSIKSFLRDDEYEIDYFIHTWDINNYRPIETIDGSEKYFYKSEVDTKSYIESYNPKLYKIQSFESFQNKLKKIKNPIPYAYNDNGNMINQMYSFKQSIVLKRIWERKNGFKYDYVIKLRPDLFFVYPSLRKNIELLEENNKTFYAYHQYGEGWENRLNDDWPPDMYWLFLSSEESDIFSSYFGKRIKYIRENSNNYDNDYHLYRFTNDIGFDPYIDRKIEIKETKFLYIIRPWNIPFQCNQMKLVIDNKKDNLAYDALVQEFIHTFNVIHSLCQETNNSTKPDFSKRKMIVDILKDNNKIDDLKNVDIIDLINNNLNIKKSIEDIIIKYL